MKTFSMAVSELPQVILDLATERDHGFITVKFGLTDKLSLRSQKAQEDPESVLFLTLLLAGEGMGKFRDLGLLFAGRSHQKSMGSDCLILWSFLVVNEKELAAAFWDSPVLKIFQDQGPFSEMATGDRPSAIVNFSEIKKALEAPSLP